MEENQAIRTQNVRGRITQGRLLVAVALVAFLLGIVAVFFIGRSGVVNVGALLGSGQTEGAVEPEAGNGAAADEGGEAATREPALPSAENSAESAEKRPVEDATDVRDTFERVEQMAQQQGGLDQRVVAMEQRLARLDLQTQAAAGNAARAEGLLIAFAARRAIERGAPLGYLADQLQLRFGDSRPNAVQTVIDAGQSPVTLDKLLSGLAAIAPELGQAPEDEGFFSWIRREASQLFVVRPADSPSPAAEQRLERARLFLQSGRTDAAIEEVRRVPNAAAATDWIADARRYSAVHRALELLEITAIFEPRELRDENGERVEQPSPVSDE